MAVQNNKWVLGVTLAIFASIISNLGINLQKKSHLSHPVTLDEQGNVIKTPNFFQDRVWVLGLSLVILGSIADFAALGFASQSIIAPLGSLTLVANVIFAPLLLKEHISIHDIGGTVVIIIGAVVAVVFANHNDHEYGTEELFFLYGKSRFGIYAAIILPIILFLFGAAEYMDALFIEHNGGPGYLKYHKYHRFCYSSLSGIVGAQSVLFAKCTVELLINSFTGHAVLFVYWQSYFILAALGASTFFQLKFLNNALQRFDALFVVPVFQSFWVLVSVISGMVYFGEYDYMSDSHLVLFMIGVSITIIGVIYLSRRGISDTLQKNQFSDQEEEHEEAPLFAGGDNIDTYHNILSLDPILAFQNGYAPLTLTPSMMGRCSLVYSVRVQSNSGQPSSKSDDSPAEGIDISYGSLA